MKEIYNSHVLSSSTYSIQNFSLLLAFLILPFTSAFSQCDENFVQIGPYHMEFVGAEYDYPEVGQSTWYYTVFATSGKDISHVTIPLTKGCMNVIDSGVWGDTMDDLYSGQGQPSVGKDPKAKIWGMKFDEGVDTGEERNYYFTLDQNLNVEPVAKMAIKAGRPFYKGTICGPSPDCNEPIAKPIESCISGQVFDDKNKNGIRESDESPIEGVVISLVGKKGIVDQMNTGSDGKYSFCGLGSGDYTVSMATPADYSPTRPNMGPDEIDSDLVGPQGTDVLSITFEGESFTNVDGGFFKTGGYDQEGFADRVDTGFSQTKTLPNKDVDNHNTFGINLNDNQPTGGNRIYPNPVSDIVTFRIEDNRSDVIIEVRTESNQLISTAKISQNNSEQSMDLSFLPQGVYIVYFISEKGMDVEKLMKTR